MMRAQNCGRTNIKPASSVLKDKISSMPSVHTHSPQYGSMGLVHTSGDPGTMSPNLIDASQTKVPYLRYSTNKTGILSPLHLEDNCQSKKHYPSKRRVSFSETLEESVSCIGRDDLSNDERQNYWYSRSELADIGQDNDRNVQRLESGIQREKSSTYRGLEIHTSAGGIYRNKLKIKHLQTFLKVQNRQRNIGSNDWLELAITSEDLSEESKRIAIDFALRDQKDAVKIQNRE
eukprot:scaffold858_cov123-Cylindrotheca_fusiformis.AAC.33